MVHFTVNVKSIPVSQIKPNPKNPRVALRKGLPAYERLRSSIEHHDYIDPIIWNERTSMIVSGHQRFQVLKDIAEEKGIPFDTVDCVVVDMDEYKQDSFMVATNKVRGLWDFERLRDLFSEMDTVTLSHTGFDQSEIQEILDSESSLEAYDDISSHINMGDGFSTLFDNTSPHNPLERKYKEIEDKPLSIDSIPIQCKKGDIWELGRHRLMCGDSTSSTDMDALLNGEIADICFTSPPYNVASFDVCINGVLDKGTTKKYLNDTDDKDPEDYADFLCACLDNILDHSTEALINVPSMSATHRQLIDMLYRFKDSFKDTIYWHKTNGVVHICKNVISSSMELIFAFSKTHPKRGFESANFDGVFRGFIEGSSASSNQYADVHKATFPLYLPLEIINKFTHEDGTVLDAFGGTGTTLLACEQVGRRCYMMELEPRYCDIILHRYEEITSVKPKFVCNVKG